MFVLDSSSPTRLSSSRDELQKLLQDEERHNAVLLILAKKQDLPNAMSVDEVIEGLGVRNMKRERDWEVRTCCGRTAEGVEEAVGWVSAFRFTLS